MTVEARSDDRSPQMHRARLQLCDSPCSAVGSSAPWGSLRAADRFAPASAARRQHPENVAGLELDRALVRQALGPRLVALWTVGSLRCRTVVPCWSMVAARSDSPIAALRAVVDALAAFVAHDLRRVKVTQVEDAPVELVLPQELVTVASRRARRIIEQVRTLRSRESDQLGASAPLPG